MDTKTVTVNIVSRWDSEKVLFSAEVDASISERYRLRAALEIGVKRGANLSGADLRGAYLRGAYLRDANMGGANMGGANLRDAYLRDANMGGANLRDTDLRDANLGGANLVDANLGGANLGGAYLVDANLGGANLGGAYLVDANLGGDLMLVGDRPYFQLGPIGSESRTFEAFITNQGLRLRAGCFFGTRDEFAAKLNQTHGNNIHASEYTAALSLIDAHYELWVPNVEAKESAA